MDQVHLHVAFRAGNGRRMTKDFPITVEASQDPMLRAQAISNASHYGIGRGWRLANWSVKNGPVPEKAK